MNLDLPTLQVVFTGNLICAALVLPYLLQQQSGHAVRMSQASVILYALSWLSLLAARSSGDGWLGTALSVLSLAGMSASIWSLWLAVRHWSGAEGASPWMSVLAVAVPVTHLLASPWPTSRLVLTSGLLVAQLLVLLYELARPHAQGGARWRGVLGVALLIQVGIHAARGLDSLALALGEPALASPSAELEVIGALGNHLSLLMVSFGVLMAFRDETEQRLRSLAVTDSLTGLLNRRAWMERSNGLMADARRYGHPLIVLMIDLDGFKSVNDQHGHAKGDEALRLVARTLSQQLRSGDLAARYGGEEFCVVLTHTREDAAITLDQRLRHALLDTSRRELGLALNYSAGLAAFRPDDPDLDQLLNRADAALYEAKRSGRGQLVLAA